MATSASCSSARWNATPTARARAARIRPASSPSRRSALSGRDHRPLGEGSDCKGCLLVNSALDAARTIRDRPAGGGLSGEIQLSSNAAFSGAAGGQVDKRLDAEAVSAHLLGVVLGIRVLARTGARRKRLESVARPALALLDAAAGSARRRRPRRA
jgi:TetR/AcrR family transcriptional repressor of nem operon